MVAALAQVSIPYQSGVPEDVSVNTWSFQIDDDTTTNYDQIEDFLDTFYSLIAQFYSPVLDMTNTGLKIYLRDDPEPRTPVVETSLGLGNANLTNDGLPEEVAVCLSFRGVLSSGSPPARRRGRVYLGPLATDVVAVESPSRTAVASGFRIAVRDAYQAAWEELTTAGNSHTVWSTVDSANRVVTDAWIDNAFDTQRRRGPQATNRLTFTPTTD